MTFGVLVDKSEVLERAAQTARERQVRLATAEAELIVQVVRAYMNALGLSFGPAAASTLADLLRPAEAGEPLVAPPAAGEARAGVRRQVSSELAGEPPLLPGGEGRARFPRPV